MAQSRAVGEQSYILEEDRKLPEEQQTVWWFRQITHRERAEMADGATRGIIRPGQRGLEQSYTGVSRSHALTRASLTRVERFFDRSGAPLNVPSDPGKVAAWFDAHVKMHQLDELTRFVMNGCELTEEDAGNSDSPSGSALTSNGPHAGTRNGENAAAAS